MKASVFAEASERIKIKRDNSSIREADRSKGYTPKCVYTVWESRGIVASVIVEYYTMKEINTRLRTLTNKTKAPAVKEGMKVSEANTEKMKKEKHRKCIGTDG